MASFTVPPLKKKSSYQIATWVFCFFSPVVSFLLLQLKLRILWDERNLVLLPSLSLSLTHTRFLSLSLTNTLSLSLSQLLAHALSLNHTHTHTHTQSNYLTHALSLSHTHTQTLTHKKMVSVCAFLRMVGQEPDTKNMKIMIVADFALLHKTHSHSLSL